MNLVIDIGNTSIKAGIFNRAKLVFHQTPDRKDFSRFLEKVKKDFPGIGSAIVSHVGKMETGWGNYLQSNFNTIEFSTNSPVPFENAYATPETLGLDRIALVSAGFQKYPGKNVLVIDAGTCITYDFLDEKGTYHGGAISPGLEMRLKALNTFTDRLPLAQLAEAPNFLGKTTFESMQSGVFWGTVHEIDGFIERYREKYPGLTIILTGGDAQILSKTIKNTIFAPSYFLLEGLNAILEFNKHK